MQQAGGRTVEDLHELIQFGDVGRFGDGRLEYRYTFELEPRPTPPIGSLISFILSPFTLLLSLLNRPRERTSTRPRPLLVRPPSS